jgi:uncharacterized protein YjiS (DUF1127 family)
MLIHSSAATAAPLRSAGTGQFRHLLAMAGTWLQRRRSRQALRDLDHRLLRDIGLTPSEAIAESAMPFWKPLIWLQGR